MINYLVPLIVSALYMILLLIVSFNRPLQKQHKLFILYLVAAAVWSASDYFLRSDVFKNQQLTLFRVVIISSLWWVVQLYCFVRSFLQLPGGIGARFGYGALAVLTILALSGFAPPGIVYSEGYVSPIYGWWFFFYVTPLLLIACFGIYTLVKRLRTLVNLEERNKAAYLVLAIGLLFIFGFSGVTPLAHLFPISHLGGLFSAIILTYAILQHDLVSIKLIIRRLLGLVSLSVIGIGIYLSLIFLLLHVFNVAYNAATIALTVIAGLVVMIFVNRLRSIVMGKLEQLFYREKYQIKHDLYNFIRTRIHSVFSLQELSQGLLPPLIKALDCHTAYMLVPSNITGDFEVAFSEPVLEPKPELRIRKNSPIITRLKREYLTRDILDVDPEFRGIWEDERNQIYNLGIDLFFPLVSRNNLVGFLALCKKRNGKYSLDDINLVESIASQAAISLEKEYYQEELIKREREIAFLNRLSVVMASSLNIQDVYDTFIDGMRETIDIDYATIALIDGEELLFSVVTTEVGSPWKIGDKIPLRETATEWVVNNKRSLREDDLSKDRMFTADDEYLKLGINSLICLPLIVKGTGIGSLIIGCKRPKAYSNEQVNLLERLTSQIATSLDNAQLYAKAEQRARVDELTNLFNRRHFDETLSMEIHRHSRYGNSFTLALIDVDNLKSYNDIFGHPAGDKLLKHVGQSLKNEMRKIDVTFRYGGDEFAIIMANTNIDDGYNAAERARNVISKSAGGLVNLSFGLASWPNDGVLPDEIVTAADTALYHAKRTGGNRTCIISQVVPPIAKTLENQADEKESLNTIHALAATIEARDSYTYGHSRKVRSFAVILAEALDYSAQKVSIVSHAALLHDIGKIGILDGILNNPGTLNNQEQEVIKTHPQLSRNIVAHVQSLTPCLPAILHHHERWDGSGYPSGLKGEMIPLDARILAIADAFDAMTSDRPYRAALSLKEAVKELQAGAGVQFDPHLIEVFIPEVIKMDLIKLKIS
jgi:diguanylate cyclase (GGDEF)-like protein